MHQIHFIFPTSSSAHQFQQAFLQAPLLGSRLLDQVIPYGVQEVDLHVLDQLLAWLHQLRVHLCIQDSSNKQEDGQCEGILLKLEQSCTSLTGVSITTAKTLFLFRCPESILMNFISEVRAWE